MIECLGIAYRELFPDGESEEELEEGLEDCKGNRQVDSKVLQEYMASQAQMIAGKGTDGSSNT